MTTFADIKARIADELDRQDLNSQIDRELRRAVTYYERQRWWFAETLSTTTATASAASVALPTDFVFLDDLETVVSGRKNKLRLISWEKFVDDWRSNTSPGEPSDYAIYADRAFLGPFPRVDTTVIWSYIKTFSPVSFTDGTDNAWTNQAEDMISARALRTISARTLNLTPQQVAQYTGLEYSAYTNMCAVNERRLMTGKTRPHM